MNKAEYEKDLFERIISAMKKHGLEACADSVFLAGSFGRGEATYTYIDGDNVKLKSDVEIGVVYSSKKAALKMIEAITPEFEEELSCMPLSRHRMTHLDNFNMAVLPSKHKSLLMYDLVHGHRTIWGKEYLDEAKLPLSKVDLYEAKRIVANRIGELIYTRQSNEGDAKRWDAKLISAIGTAYLLYIGEYKCSYRDQMDALERASEKADSAIGSGFYDSYRRAFAFLRMGEAVFDADEKAAREYVKNINDIFTSAGLKKPKINTFSRNLKYTLKYVKKHKKLDFIGLEERIIDSLIDGYITGSEELPKMAKLWYDVLY